MSDEENKPADTTAKLQPKQEEALKAPSPIKREPERNTRFEKWQKIQNAAAKLGATVHDPKKFETALNDVRNAAK